MEMETSGCGCFGGLFLLLVSGFLGFFGLGAVASPPVAVAPAPTPITRDITPTLELVFAPDTTDFTEEALQATVGIVDERLRALSNAGQLGAFYELGFGPDDRITVRVGNSMTDSELVSLITDSGFLEIIDFSTVAEPERTTIVGTTIVTAAQDPAVAAILPTILTHEDIVGAIAFIDDFGNHAIQIDLTFDGAATLGDFTEANVGSGLAIVLDGVVLSVPTVQARVETPVILMGNFTELEAQTLAAQIDSEPLPVPLVVESITIISQP